jgi:DNA replication protein DnaC
MNLVELDRALRQLRLSGMAAVLDTRLRQAQTEKMAPLDLVSALVSDELCRRQDRLLERRHKLARFRDPERSLDTFDFDFNKKMNRALVYELATARFIAQAGFDVSTSLRLSAGTSDQIQQLAAHRSTVSPPWVRASEGRPPEAGRRGYL